jgi:hypothetical protein
MRFSKFVYLLMTFPLFGGTVFTDPKTGLQILSADIELPGEGYWYLPAASIFTKEIGFATLDAPEAHVDQSYGKRNQALRERRQLQERRRLMYGIRSLLRPYQEDEIPLSPIDLTTLNFENRKEEEAALRSGKIAILPGIPTRAEKDEAAQILLVELEPQIDDGKHFISYNNWELVREEIDVAKMQALGLKILPPPAASPAPKTVSYSLKARLMDPALTEIHLTLKNDYPAGELNISVPVSGSNDNRQVFTEWAESRAYSWWMEDSRLADMWDRQVSGLYGLENFKPAASTGRNNRNRSTSLMGVLGGDAAIRETLQMQNLLPANDTPQNPIQIPITEIRGVEVKAHNYEELLDGKAGGQLALATLCPPDRLFAWFPQPEGLLHLLEGSGNVLGRFGASDDRLILDQQILEKHLAKLELSREQLTLILQSGMIGETALILPDLFLAEGTDVSSITRIKNLPALRPLLKGMGIHPEGDIQTLSTPSGSPFYACIQENWLMIGSSAPELNRILQTQATPLNSLGASAEFRYMLTQCGPTDQTAAYVYLSDPFIRRLTGPALKIAQMRRLQAVAELEALSAGDLLYRMDHLQSAPDIQTLIENGYAPAPRRLKELSWQDGVATDATWGSAANPVSLSGLLPGEVSAAEKTAYDQYRDQYERFWRQFFDPIAVRVDIKPENEVETTVFILPLIHSSIYDTVRRFFPTDHHLAPGNAPQISPAPIAQMSLHLSEDMWIDFLEGIANVVERQLGLELPIWEQIGPGIHMGLADADAIITFGSGELMNLFSAGNNIRGNDMLFVPLIGSLFTRPVYIAIDLQDPVAAREALRGMVTGQLIEQNGFLDLSVNLVKITDADRWLIRLRLGDLLFITLSMEVQGDYLVFSNLPLSYAPQVTGSIPLPLRDATLTLHPEAIHETGPGFATSSLDKAREQAMAGLGVLNLYYMAGMRSLEEALAASQKRFGYVPVHPSPGEFKWTEAGPVSSVFGSLYSSEQPPLDQLDIPGLLPRTQRVDISMQLENEGLRTRLLWKGKAEND